MTSIKCNSLDSFTPIRTRVITSSSCGCSPSSPFPSTHHPLLSTIIVCLSQTTSLCFQDISDVYLIVCLEGFPPFLPTAHPIWMLCRVTMMGIMYMQQDLIAACFWIELCDLLGNLISYLFFFKYSDLCIWSKPSFIPFTLELISIFSHYTFPFSFFQQP